jgi:DNA invertase Pin-like site-specific DNA recombinase
MKRAALYIRVSTEEQARHGLSLDEQRDSLKKYVSQHDLAIVGIYEDAGISARKPYKKRPALLQLLEDCKAGKVDVILFIKLDRWFRNVGNYYAVQDILDRCGVSWQATQEDYETTTASGRLKVNIMLSVAQDEADRTSERIKFVFQGKRARGEPLGGMLPTGYKLDGKKIIKDPDTEPAITAYFQKYMESGSISTAIDYVAAQTGVRLKYQLASNILSKPAYYGEFNGVPDMCPPYITKEQYDMIASGRKRIARRSKSNRTYLFSGLLTCGECGARMGARAHQINGIEKAEYNCPGHYQKKGCSNRTNIREAAIEQYLLDTVDLRLEKYLVEIAAVKSVQAKDHSAEISKCRRQLAKLKELYLNDLITLDEYRQDHGKLTAQISSLEAAQSKPHSNISANLQQTLCAGWQDLYSALDKPSKRAFWRLAIKEIRVYPDRHIEYDFL